MQLIEGRLVLSPTDLTKHLACRHATTLDRAAAYGRLPVPAAEDLGSGLAARYGLMHERAHLAWLAAAGRSVTEIVTAYDDAGRRSAEQATVRAMQAGTDVIYQAQFYDKIWGGQADFLLRNEEPSDLGAWSYDIADAKLARALKVPALLQMATYAERLAVLQGRPPRWLTVVGGDGVQRRVRLLDVSAYARRARARLSEALAHPVVIEAVPVAYCEQCRWSTRCGQGWRDADDLSLVAGLRSDQRQRLRDGGVRTVVELAAATPDRLPVARAVAARVVQQARLQIAERSTGTPTYELLTPHEHVGLCRLPEPDAGDLYLDFEGDPFAADGQGREYLAGIGDRSGGFVPLWAHDADAERDMVRRLIDRLLARAHAHPRMHVYHYAPYETAALKRLTARYGVREAELDQLLRAERFVDLYGVVRQGLQVSKESYSIKYLEHFYWGAVRGGDEVSGALDSVAQYEAWLADGEPSVLAAIEAYNRKDVESTLALHDWLEARRTEAAGRYGPLPRPAGADPAAQVSEVEAAEAALAEKVRATGDRLLAALVQWHRREARPRWWDVFRLTDLSHEDLVDDASALGGLGAPSFVGPEKRSSRWRYAFPPQQTKIGREAVYDVDDAPGTCGTILEVDPIAGHLDLKVGPGKSPPAARAFGANTIVQDGVLRDAIAEVAAARLQGRATPGSRLLDRVVPADLRPRPGEKPGGTVVRVGRALAGQVLAVQGPPGSGKTTVAAELIQTLLDDGKRVGVTANSHAVIGHLLTCVGRPAVQKCTPAQHCGQADVVAVDSNDAVRTAIATGTTLIGGTAWLWARADMRDSVDVLVVDEAGQFSLANTVAVAGAAASLVLLGDPQQLTAPTQAQHPDGGHVSALRHLIGDRDTIPAERGIFLDTTWRLHPRINDFVSDLAYDGRLGTGPKTATQQLAAPGRLTGTGLRFLPVHHEGRDDACPEEVRVVAALIEDLLDGKWTDRDGVTRTMTPDDVLVVTPYNAHLRLLRAALPADVRVGTVDNFQGREAPVVVYSMASSSAVDAPRGVDFLYDLHRLNVAVSRAQGLAVIVASPTLLDAAVRTPEQLRQVNALCRFVELAEIVTAPT